MPPQIAVAVVSWNTRELLDACLTSLRPDHDAVLPRSGSIDNASQDGSADMVAERHPWVRLVRSEDEPGIRARRQRDRAAHDDAVPRSRERRPALRARRAAGVADGLRAPPRRGRARPAPGDARRVTQHTVHPFPTVRVGLRDVHRARDAPPHRQGPVDGGFWDASVEQAVDWVHGAIVLVPRRSGTASAASTPISGSTPRTSTCAGACARAGHTTWLVPSAVVHHHVSAAATQSWDAAARRVRTQRSAYAWMLHRQGPVRTWAVALAHLAGPLPRLPGGGRGRGVARALGGARADSRRTCRMHRTGLESTRSPALAPARRGTLRGAAPDRTNVRPRPCVRHHGFSPSEANFVICRVFSCIIVHSGTWSVFRGMAAARSRRAGTWRSLFPSWATGPPARPR